MRSTAVAGWVGIAALLTGCESGQSPVRADLPRLQGAPLVARDSSGLGHDGVNQGSPETGVPGHRGTAYSFSSAKSWIQVSSTNALNPGSASFLVGAWVNLHAPPPIGGTMDLVRKGLNDSRGGEFKLEIVPDGRVKCTVKDAANHDATKYGPAVNVADGSWHWVACARTPGHLSGIVGNRRASKRIRTGVVRNSLPLAIGSKYGLEDTPGGRVDEVRFYIAPVPGSWDRDGPPLRRRLSFLQQPEHLVGLWHLDEPGGR